jgi:hypothetical protein
MLLITQISPPFCHVLSQVGTLFLSTYETENRRKGKATCHLGIISSSAWRRRKTKETCVETAGRRTSQVWGFPDRCNC